MGVMISGTFLNTAHVMFKLINVLIFNNIIIILILVTNPELGQGGKIFF